MPRRSYVTNMPDKTGAFLLASKIIARHGGNIARVSYNKAVDLHTLFIDVEASTEENLTKIAKELDSVGYLSNISETRVIIVEIKIPDKPGAVLPILKILDRYDINISYINSSATGSEYQNFKMGLLIEKPDMIKMLLDDISELYQIDIIDYDDTNKSLDNTIFYIRLANETQKLLNLSSEATMEFISESNRILQVLEEKGEDPKVVFSHIYRFVNFISARRGINFKADIEKLQISEKVTLYSIQPPCGSNTYILDSNSSGESGDLILIDTGYAIYRDEMLDIFKKLFPDWDSRMKRIFITHADVDHCGLLSQLEGARIFLNRKSAEGLNRQKLGIPDYRENSDLNLGYSKLSRIISGYEPPDSGSFVIIDSSGTPEEHEDLMGIGSFMVEDMLFEVYEGSGGHLYGEMVFVSMEHGIAFTGDNLINITGFSPERSEFNSLAPYLMGSVNINSDKATRMRRQIASLIDKAVGAKQPCVVCGGHGPISLLQDGRLIKAELTERMEI